MVHFEELEEAFTDAVLWCCEHEEHKDREIVIRPFFACYLGHCEEDHEMEWVLPFEHTKEMANKCWEEAKKCWGRAWWRNFWKSLGEYRAIDDDRTFFVVGFHVFVRYDISVDGNKCCLGFDSERR